MNKLPEPLDVSPPVGVGELPLHDVLKVLDLVVDDGHVAVQHRPDQELVPGEDGPPPPLPVGQRLGPVRLGPVDGLRGVAAVHVQDRSRTDPVRVPTVVGTEPVEGILVQEVVVDGVPSIRWPTATQEQGRGHRGVNGVDLGHGVGGGHHLDAEPFVE